MSAYNPDEDRAQLDEVEEAAASAAMDMIGARPRSSSGGPGMIPRYDEDDDDDRSPTRRDAYASDKEGAAEKEPTKREKVDRDRSRSFPDQVGIFLKGLYDAVHRRDADRLRDIYEVSFNRLTNQYFHKSPWPHASDVRKFYHELGLEDELPLVLYQEMYWRREYGRLGLHVTLEERCESWSNYIDLLEYLIDQELSDNRSQPSIDCLPTSWVWDILDEFVYQFQTFHMWRGKSLRQYGDDIRAEENDKGEAADDEEDSDVQRKKRQARKHRLANVDISVILEKPDMWSADKVLELLTSMVEKSGIKEALQTNRAEQDGTTNGNRETFVGQSLTSMLGYFSLVCLLRVQTQLGNYTVALEAISEMEISSRSYYARVPPCHITLAYYLSFCYLMLKRYYDCIRTLQTVLLFVYKTRNYLDTQGGHIQYDAMRKTCDRMLHILYIATTIHPFRLDDTVASYLKDRVSDRQNRYGHRDDDRDAGLVDAFSFAAPKFLTTEIPAREEDYVKISPTEPQIEAFKAEMEKMRRVTTFRSYVKLYNNITIAKLAKLMGKTNLAEVKEEAQLVRQSSRQLVWKQGPPLSGELVVLADVDITVEKDLVHVHHLRSKNQQRNYVDQFMRNINKLQEIIDMTTPGSGIASRNDRDKRMGGRNWAWQGILDRIGSQGTKEGVKLVAAR